MSQLENISLLKDDERAVLNDRGCPRCEQHLVIELLTKRLICARLDLNKSDAQKLHEAVTGAIEVAYKKLQQDVAMQERICATSMYSVTPARLLELMKRYLVPLVSEEALTNYWKLIAKQ